MSSVQWKQERTPPVIWKDSTDAANPRNFSRGKKLRTMIILALLAESASMGSSIFAPASPYFSAEFHRSTELGTLATALYVVGFAFGPLIWAPISEIWGRRISMIPACFAMALFSLGTALSQNVQTLFILRFLEGVCGSAPVSNVSAAIGDMYTAQDRAVAGTLYATAVIGGPTLGPVIGSALSQSRLGWRWCGWIETIWMFSTATLALLFMPEVYAPVLLAQKAKRLRSSGQDFAWHPHERKLATLTIQDILTRQLIRPIKMLLTEPIVTCVASYASFTYSIQYFALEAFPVVFEEIRGFEPLPGSLPFISILVGVCCASIIVIYCQRYYANTLKELQVDVAPEARTPPMLIGAILLPVGLYWFAWTAARNNISWVVPTIAAAVFGAGFAVVFQQCIMVLVDSYGLYAASAVSANTFLRSFMAAGFPYVISSVLLIAFSVFAKPMLLKIGVGPSLSIMGTIAAIAIPIPILLKLYGQRLRAHSKYNDEDSLPVLAT